MAFRSFVTTLLCALAVAACSATQAAEPAGATCDQFASTPSIAQTRTIDSGTELIVILCSNPSTGFAWDEPQIADAAVLEIIDRTYRAPDQGTLSTVGAAGGDVLTLRGLEQGTTTLSIRYSQPWEGGAKGEWTYELEVTVR